VDAGEGMLGLVSVVISDMAEELTIRSVFIPGIVDVFVITGINEFVIASAVEKSNVESVTLASTVEKFGKSNNRSFGISETV
jgi:hypothetical protein